MNNAYRLTITPRFQALLELSSHQLSRSLDMALAIFLFLVLASSPAMAAAEHDPFEKVNRVTFGFNAGFDKVILKPLASGYDSYTPKLAKKGIRNFFSNLDDIRIGVNDLMQLKIVQAANDFGRFAINSTVGVAGLFDVAAPALDLQKNQEDFGKTLAHWGVGAGPYLVLPILGPTTARDALGLSVDVVVDPIPSLSHVSSRNSLIATKTADRRASYLSFDDLIIGDEYLFVRGIYLQSREYAINGDYVDVAFEDF